MLPELPDAVLALAPQARTSSATAPGGTCRPRPRPYTPPPRVTGRSWILDGGLDAVTAPANGELVARLLPAATRVVFPDSAHDVLLSSTPCALTVMRSFLDQPTAPDVRCAVGLTPAPFATG